MNPEQQLVYRRLISNAARDEDGKMAYAVQCLSSMVKVRPKSFVGLEKTKFDSQIKLQAAMGEYANEQILIFSPDKDLEIESLEISDLTSDTGKIISKENAMVAPVGYVINDLPDNLDWFGWWPDPILPFLNKFTVKKGDLQTIWVRINVPRKIQAGTYTGQVTIKPQNAPSYEVPVTVKVLDFELPVAFSFRVISGLAYTDESFWAEYGFNFSSIYSRDIPTKEQLKRWAEDGRLTAFQLKFIWPPNMNQTTKMPDEQDVEKWINEVEQCLNDAEELGIRDKAYLYIFDEAGGGVWAPAMEYLVDVFHKKFPDLLILTTSYNIGFGDTDKMPGLSTCPLFQKWSPVTADRARAKGREVWWYTANSPEQPYPNVKLAHPGISTRQLMGFMTFAMKPDGYLYYMVQRYWHQRPTVTTGPYLQDWKMILNGCGELTQRGPDGPLPSVRLENFRDGLQDYEYLKLAQDYMLSLEKNPKAKAAIQSSEYNTSLNKVKPLFTPGSKIVQSLSSFTHNPQEIEKARDDLAKYIIMAKEISDR